MSYGLQIEVWGDYALFSRPELKVERMSYDVMPPSAARGLVEAIYWHPGLRVYIDRIHVLNEIQFTGIRRNEVESTVQAGALQSMLLGTGAPPMICTKDSIQQRASLLLRDVRYVIEAHFELTDKAAPGDNPGKFKDIFRRRLEKGQCYHQPCFGCREFPAHFRAWPGGDIPTVAETRDLGLMTYDFDYSDPQNIQPLYFRARLEHGVLEVAGQEVLR